MDSLVIVLFICISIPLALSLVFLDKNARRFVLFLIIGAFICVFASQINSLLMEKLHLSLFYTTTNITPIVEEVMKAYPVLLFAYTCSDDRKTLIAISMATGIGFAIVENMLIFAQSDFSLSVIWAVKRVFGASLMHGICTAAVGYGISFVRKRKKLFYTGTFALLVAAMVYHCIYNEFIQSSFSGRAWIMPVISYIPLVAGRVLKSQKQVQ